MIKKKIYYIIVFMCSYTYPQEKINIEFKSASDTLNGMQQSNLIEMSDKEVVENNIVYPSVTLYRPKNNNRSAIILIPGGGLYALFSDSQGVRTAEWLNSQGYNVFLFRHTLKKSLTNNPVQDLLKHFSLQSDYAKILNDTVYSKAVDDAGAVAAFIRHCADEINIYPDRIGIMGFSSGAAIALDLYLTAPKNKRPNFLISINGFIDSKMKISNALSDPVFLASTSSSALQESIYTLKLYEKIGTCSVSVELHIYKDDFDQETVDEKWKNDLHDWLKRLKF